MTHKGIEIEYKYLIEYPDIGQLMQQPGCRIAHIRQTYLLSENEDTVRVRSWAEGQEARYYHTLKHRLTDQSNVENEMEIDLDTYTQLLSLADPSRKTIEKTRYIIPHDKHFLEIDIYPFWSHQAILEIETEHENEMVLIPAYLHILRDVTADFRYKNRSLAKDHDFVDNSL